MFDKLRKARKIDHHLQENKDRYLMIGVGFVSGCLITYLTMRRPGRVAHNVTYVTHIHTTH